MFAHKLSSEVCSSPRFEVFDASRWGADNSVKNEELLRDWLRRCVSVPNLKRVSVSALYDFRISGTSILYLFEIDRTGETTVEGFFFSVCSIEEAQRVALFTTIAVAKKEAIMELILLTIFHGKSRCSSATKHVVVRVRRKITVLSESFETSCRQVMSERKRAMNDAYFGALWYATMCGTGRKFSNIIFYHQVISKELMATSKLTQTVRNSGSQAKHRDLLYWRKSNTSEICNDALLSEFKLSDDSFKMHKLFKNEAGQRAYLVFRTFGVSRSTKLSILSIARPDAIIVCIVDGLQSQSERSRTGKPRKVTYQL